MRPIVRRIIINFLEFYLNLMTILSIKYITGWYNSIEVTLLQKEDEDMSAYVKPIQATPTLSGKDALDIVKQVLRTPSPESIDKKKKMLEARKRIENK